MPSPLAVPSSLAASISSSASASLPRHAAIVSDAYFSGAMPVACVIASASAISDEAAPSSPAWTCRAARYVAAIGSTLSAPASLARRSPLVESTYQSSSSQRSWARRHPSHSQRKSRSVRPSTSPSASSALRSGGRLTE
jgi:hypothetical protein